MWYQVLGFLGLALGSILSGTAIATLERSHSTETSFRIVFAFYSIVALVKVVLNLCLSDASEAQSQKRASSKPNGEPTRETLQVEIVHDGGEDERRPLLRSPTSIPRIDTKIPTGKKPVPQLTSGRTSLPLLRLTFTCVLFSVDSFASSLVPGMLHSGLCMSGFIVLTGVNRVSQLPTSPSTSNRFSTYPWRRSPRF